MLDTRRYLLKLLGQREKFSLPIAIKKFMLSLIIALCIAFIPNFTDLNASANMTFFILIFGAGLWVSEAIPAFAVSLLIIALEIILLGFPNFDFTRTDNSWKTYLQPWSSPLIFLFLAGFIMASAASKTKLDLWLAKKVLFFVGDKPANVLTGVMSVTFILSMFISNTATTAMMLAVIYPILKNIKKDNPFAMATLLAVAVSANIGGMGTIIGTPPNAIAIGILKNNAPGFLEWMILAIPPSLLMIIFVRKVLLKLYPSNEEKVNLQELENVVHFDDSSKDLSKIPTIPSWKKMIVISTFLFTISLWLTEPLHHIPTTVVSLFPIVIFTIFGIIDVEDIRSLNWDILILIIGGLSLGLAVSDSGLALWFAKQIGLNNPSLFLLTIIFSYAVLVISNFMSNTAATNIMLPIVMAIVIHMPDSFLVTSIVSITLSVSFAMCLPVSTPPNAIIYSSGKIRSKDFLKIGIITGIIGPIIVISWILFFKTFIYTLN